MPVSLFLCGLNWNAIATAFAGTLAVGSAVTIARRQQRIKEQELRLSLLSERRDLIRRFRSFQSTFMGRTTIDDEGVQDFCSLVREVELYFDRSTARAVEEAFDDVWAFIAAKASIKLYREDEMHGEAREEVKKQSQILRRLVERMPTALRLMTEKTRVPDNL